MYSSLMSLRHEATRAADVSSLDRKGVGAEVRLLTTRQFASAVGASVLEVVDKHRAGVFVASIIGGKGRGAKTLYSQDQVEAWKARVALRDVSLTRNARQHFTGDEARQCFKAFAEGLDNAHCVTEFGIHPLTVEAIRASWASMKASLFVPADYLEKIQSLTLDGPLPIKTVDDLLEVLQIASQKNEPKPCVTCRRGERAVCRRCVAVAKVQAVAPPPPASPEPPALDDDL